MAGRPLTKKTTFLPQRANKNIKNNGQTKREKNFFILIFQTKKETKKNKLCKLLPMTLKILKKVYFRKRKKWKKYFKYIYNNKNNLFILLQMKSSS